MKLPEERRKKLMIVFGILFLVLVLALVGISTYHPGKKPENVPEIKLVNSSFDRTGLPEVKGTIKNVGREEISYLSVHVRFYGSDGNMMQDRNNLIRNLSSGETRSFSVMYLIEENRKEANRIDDYEIAVETDPASMTLFFLREYLRGLLSVITY